jgi:hypothetical protein
MSLTKEEVALAAISLISYIMEKGNIKTQNPKCRLCWYLIEFMDWRYSQYVGIFDPIL